ncbi:MAG: radical SAM/SPASM domain-containing protein [Acidobacteria bacterium]|nr:MAG: radical SAM/SPASM domain-containing protein [Acidobacteriota bacterium]
MSTSEPHPAVMWELTRACDLHCRGCPSGAEPRRGANELTTYEAYKTIDQIAELEPRELIITGGDPLEREDVYQVIDYARRRGLDPALVLSPTSQLTYDAIARLEQNGLTRVVFSIDGSTPGIHQPVHGVAGTFAATMRAIRWAESAGLRIDVNTLVCARNRDDLESIVDVIRPLGIARWNVHFLVPVGGSVVIEMITAEEVERVFAQLDEIRERENFAIRVIEAPHYRRFRLERKLQKNLEWPDFATYESESPETNAFMYISHAGDVRPSEFIPQSAGNLRYRSLSTIYRGSDLLVALRDPANLKGKCGRCDYRHVCGGSRARAWAMTGDLFASDPLCAYEPEHVGATPRVDARKGATA